VLVDFGIAKEIVDEAGMTTTTGARGLTPGFAPPEQYGAWSGRTDARSDIYAFSATLYVLLTNEVPADALSRMTKPEKFVPLARHAIKVSRSLAQAIDKALALEPENRFQSAEEMKTALRTPNAIAGPETPQPEPQSATIASDDTTTLGETVTVRVSKRGRLPFPILGAGFVGAVALAGFAVFMAFGRGASPVATNTIEPTETESVATPTVRATNTDVPGKTPVPLTAAQAQTAIPPTSTATSTPTVTNTNTVAPATNTRVATKTPLPTPTATQQATPTTPATTDSISNRVNAEGEGFVTISVNYTLVSVPDATIGAVASGVKADNPTQYYSSGWESTTVGQGSGTVEMTLPQSGCPRAKGQVNAIRVIMSWRTGQGGVRVNWMDGHPIQRNLEWVLKSTNCFASE
jgi:serine/threonine protein kinase